MSGSTFEYVVFIYDGVTKNITVPFKPVNLQVPPIKNGDIFNYLGSIGFHLHTYTSVNTEIVYIFERETVKTGTVKADFDLAELTSSPGAPGAARIIGKPPVKG
ncbi:MAG: hypothetical protein J0I20_33760 [Chloroflexi bacterium]|nr:hypothetical protein [Chloroflexota bacterium]OJW05571.1 MAG: hypothetical protein BGO39_02845 [Chloroflexi bacterium 54-19]